MGFYGHAIDRRVPKIMSFVVFFRGKRVQCVKNFVGLVECLLNRNISKDWAYKYIDLGTVNIY